MLARMPRIGAHCVSCLRNSKDIYTSLGKQHSQTCLSLYNGNHRSTSFDAAILPPCWSYIMGTLNVVATVKAFSSMLVTKGIAAIGDAVNAGQTRATWFAGMKKHGVDSANVKTFRPEFDRVCLGYLETKHPGLSPWLVETKDAKGTVTSPFVNTKGKKYTKRELETLIRALRIYWQNEFEKFLTGDTKKKTTRADRTIFEQDIRAVYPRMVAFQNLKTPTQYELDHLKLIRGVLEHATANDPAAKAEYRSLEAKQLKMVK